MCLKLTHFPPSTIESSIDFGSVGAIGCQQDSQVLHLVKVFVTFAHMGLEFESSIVLVSTLTSQTTDYLFFTRVLTQAKFVNSIIKFAIMFFQMFADMCG